MDSYNERQASMEQLLPLIQEQLTRGKQVKFSPRGTSMLPMLRQGRDSVTLSPLPSKLNKYDLPLYRRDNGQFVLHRVIDAGETYTCMGDNQFVPEPNLRHGQMIGLVTAFCRDGKEISVRSPGYRLYCRLWHFSRPLRHLWRRGKGWLRRHISE
jgi:hypothetical protein